jgi:hypothetical protein
VDAEAHHDLERIERLPESSLWDSRSAPTAWPVHYRRPSDLPLLVFRMGAAGEFREEQVLRVADFLE